MAVVVVAVVAAATGRTAAAADLRCSGGMDRYESEPMVSEDDVLTPVNGILDVLDNYAFVRTSGYLPGSDDAYVSLSMVKKFGLRKGDVVTGAIRQLAGRRAQGEVQPAGPDRHDQRRRPRASAQPPGVRAS